MSIKKPAIKKGKDLFSRDALLGGVDKAFTLGDSEIVIHNIFEFILKLVMDKTRLHYVESLMNEYIIDKTFILFKNLIQIEVNTSAPDIEIEYKNKTFEINFDIERPKIDAWAYNKTKTMYVKPGEIPALNEPIIIISAPVSTLSVRNSIRHNSKIGTLLGLPSLIKSAIKGGKSESKELIDLKAQLAPIDKSMMNNSSNIFGNKSSNLFINSNTKENSSRGNKLETLQPAQIIPNKKKVFITNNKKEEIVVEQFPIENENREDSQIDELDVIKEKAYRTYFREKEIERLRRNKLEKELEENFKEEEKKRKKIIEEMSRKPFSFDFDGKVLQVKHPDPQKLYHPPVANGSIKEKKLIIDGEEILLNQEINLKNKIPLKKKKVVIKPVEQNIFIRAEEEVYDLPVRFYQPDPTVSYNINPGVNMKFHGTTVEGGKFPSVDNKLTREEFLMILQHNHSRPSKRVLLTDHNKILVNVDEQDLIPEEVTMESNTMRLSKIFLMMTDDQNEELYQHINEKIRKENILKGFSSNAVENKKMNSKHALYEIRKKQKADKIRAMREFNIENVDKLDDEKIYDLFNLIEKKIEMVGYSGAEPKKMPRNVHVALEKELGPMKKYPRERLSKDILAITGKVKVQITKNDSKKNTNLDNLSIK